MGKLLPIPPGSMPNRPCRSRSGGATVAGPRPRRPRGGRRQTESAPLAGNPAQRSRAMFRATARPSPCVVSGCPFYVSTLIGASKSVDAKQVWRAALGELQVSLSPANFETWLKETALVAVDDNRFTVAVPNGFAKDWLETRYRSLISQTLARVVGYSVQVDFEVREGLTGVLTEDAQQKATDSAAATPAPTSQHIRLEPGRVGGSEGGSLNLNPRYTFRNFIVGSANRLAHAASLSVAELPGHAYNPLFLYGGVSLGNTHLMHAIRNQGFARFPRKRVVYATSKR